jgi:hypothetical protein
MSLATTNIGYVSRCDNEMKLHFTQSYDSIQFYSGPYLIVLRPQPIVQSQTQHISKWG